ncbi:hypothetical protein Hanom_Chr08g00710881 [Helianthus anomalus]
MLLLEAGLYDLSPTMSISSYFVLSSRALFIVLGVTQSTSWSIVIVYVSIDS